MGHPTVENTTPFAFEALFIADEEGRPLIVPIVKATYKISRESGLQLAEEQVAVDPAGKFHGEPGKSSYRYEPETAFIKLATDVALIGSAWTSPRSRTQADVRLTVGNLSKSARITGDRHWLRSLGTLAISDPEPFESLPLIYERAFGGGDPQGKFDLRNPLGKGYYSDASLVADGDPLPNMEDPRDPICEPRDRPVPVGFGFVAPEWEPRLALAGAYDEVWAEQRMPLLPANFNRRFFNAASSGLRASGYLNGHEEVRVENVSPDGPIGFLLPGIAPPECDLEFHRGRDVKIRTVLDTIIIDTDANLLFLLWRGHRALLNGPHDVRSLKIRSEGLNTRAEEDQE